MSKITDRLDRLCAASLSLSGARVFLTVVGLYYAAAWLVRMGLLSGSSGDEAQLMLYGQGFALGYDFGNPPIAGWLSALAERLFGPTLGATVAIRYGLLMLFFAAMLAAAREAIADRRLAAAAALSPVAFWFLGWASLTVYMDSLALIVALAATVWLMLRLARRPTGGGFLALVPVFAVGLLGKFSYGPTVLLLILAAFAVPRMRKVVLDRRFWLAAAGGVILATPAYAHVILQMDTWIDVAEARILEGAVADVPPEGAVERGLLVLLAALNFSLPMLPLFLVLFAPALWRLRDRPIPQDQRPVVLWLGLWMLLLLLVLAAAMAVAEIDKLREHYLFVLVPLPILLFALIPSDAAGPRPVGAYLGLLCVLAMVALGGLAAQAVVQPFNCTKCRLVMPWPDYAEKIRALGFDRGTIVSFDSPSTDAGPNLRRYMDGVRVWTNKREFYSPPPMDEAGGCIVVWNETRYPTTIDYLRAAKIAEIDAPIPEDTVIGTIKAELPLSGRPAPVLGYALIADGIGRCR